MTKHEGENPDALRAMYYPNLKLYENASSLEGKGTEQKAKMAAQRFLYRSGKCLSSSIALLTRDHRRRDTVQRPR